MKISDVKIGQTFREIHSGKPHNNRIWLRAKDFYRIPIYVQVDGTEQVVEISNDPDLYKEQEIEIVPFSCEICKGKGEYSLFRGTNHCSCLIGQVLSGTYKIERLHVTKQ